MRYLDHYRVNAPLRSVAAFHQQHASMGAISARPIWVEWRRVPPPLSGGEMDFTLWFGPLPTHRADSIEYDSESGFTDRQIGGPFSKWVHRHSLLRSVDHTTEVVDQISRRLKPRLLWRAGRPGFLAWAAGSIYISRLDNAPFA